MRTICYGNSRCTCQKTLSVNFRSNTLHDRPNPQKLCYVNSIQTVMQKPFPVVCFLLVDTCSVLLLVSGLHIHRGITH
jgi:hypothetical protein